MIKKAPTFGLAFGLALGLASISTPAHAYVREAANWNPSTLPITYYVNQGTIPSTLGTATGIAAVDGGFASWAAPTCTAWRTTDAGNTMVTANTGDRRNVIMWLTAWPAEYGSSTIGVTTPVWSGRYFIDADIVFNAHNFTWNTTGTGGGGSNVDAQSIATHEEGHFLGLDHSASGTAVMYASYSGGLKRTLTADDQSGVCTIYPSGAAATDAGPMPDAGTSSSDPCAAHAPACGDCTPYAGCGFCAASSQCMSGTRTGPTGASCGSWAWYDADCATIGAPDAGGTTPVDAGSATGAGRFGDPCSQPTDCASGGLCARETGAAVGFCTRACADDCGCPTAYDCYAISASTSICIPGTNACSMEDAAVIMPGSDAAVITPGDDAAVITPGSDAAMVSPGDDGGTTQGTRAGGCACVAAGASNGGMGASALGLALLGIVAARRRRTRR